MHGHGRRERVGVADDREAAVVGDVERLVRVGRPRVRVGHPTHRLRPSAGAPPTTRTPRRRAPRRRAHARSRHTRRTGRSRPSGCCRPAVRRSRGRRRPPARHAGPRAGSGPGRRPRRRWGPRARGSAAAGRPRDGARHRPRRAGVELRSGRPARRDRPRSNAVSRAVARQVKFAIVAPVTKPTADSGGSPSRSSSHRPATSSAAAAAGVSDRSPTFWSHAEVSQSAPSAAGRVPPMTMPKNRPDGMPTSPGSQASASRSTTSAAGVGPSGRSPRRRTTSSASAVGGTGRSSRDRSQVSAWCRARSSAASRSSTRPSWR